jgi:drug/metabolite transporter (DMT)-like permease
VVGSGPWPSTSGVLTAAYIGLAPMAAGYALWTRAMAHGGAERLAPLGYATPLLSTVVLLVTGAPATGSTLVGVGLVLACSIGVLAHERSASSPATGSRPTPLDRARHRFVR